MPPAPVRAGRPPARVGGVRVTGAPSTRKPGPSRKPLVRPRRSSRCTTCTPPAFSTRTTAPTQPVSTSSTTVPGSAASSTERPRAGRRQSPPSTSPPYLSVTAARLREVGCRHRHSRASDPARRIGTPSARVPAPAPCRPSRRPGGDHVMSEDRRLRVLRAIVQDYVQTSEPVGSKALRRAAPPRRVGGDRPQRHGRARGGGADRRTRTPAPGGCPTDAGYRLFVDRLSAVKPMTAAEQRAIAHVPRGRRRPRRRRRPHRAPARVADPPGRRRAVPVADALVGAPRRARADRRRTGCSSCSSPTPAGSSSASSTIGDRPAQRRRRGHPRRRLRTELNRATSGRTPHRGGQRARGRARPARPGRLRDLVRRISTALEDSLVEEREERVVLAGTANLARFGPDFTLSLGPVLEALEEHVVLLKLLGTVGRAGRQHRRADRAREPVRRAAAPPRWSPPATAPAPTSSPASGCVGPTRMDYPTTMASVRAVAPYVSRILAE